MADWSWLSKVPWDKVASVAGNAVQQAGTNQGRGEAQAGYDRGTALMEDNYQRILQAISGDMGYTPAQATGIQRPVGDVGAKLAQQDALFKLQEAARDGYSVMDRAAINAALSQANENERMQRQAILSRMDPRSGAALAAQMQAQSSAANRANQNALDIAAQSRAKALAALGAYGNLAGNMRNQEYGEQTAIDRFNADIGRWNVGQINNARSQAAGNKLSGLNQLNAAAGAYRNSDIAGSLFRGGTTAGNAGAFGETIKGIGSLWTPQNGSQPSGDSTAPNNGTDPAPFFIRDPAYDPPPKYEGYDPEKI